MDDRALRPEDFDEFLNLDGEESKDEHDKNLSFEDLRRLGNHHFSIGEVEVAYSLYSSAIDQIEVSMMNEPHENKETAIIDSNKDKLTDHLVVHLCNRSACNYKMENYEAARNDAKRAYELSNGSSLKAAFRLARAEMALSQYENCVSFLESVLISLKGHRSDQVASSTAAQLRELEKLLQQSKKQWKAVENSPQLITSVKLCTIKPSIKDFEIGASLGAGNFSSIVICKHKTTNEEFALKIIEKKQAETLAKRQHPNVYNEINMERRVLGERLQNPTHPLIIRLYHSFQDYNSLYFLMDLQVGGEVWSTLRYRNKMVGCHFSIARFYLAELVEALEFIHSRGIVHRDLKAENMIISDTGHLVLIDFGTAKDLVQRDLNGPEFVGTPDFMPPEAVKGTDEVNVVGGADHTADLWSLGCVVYQILSGEPPFSAQSPYLTFLKIERGNLYRSMAITDDDAWDLIKKLCKVNPCERLGANLQPSVSSDPSSPLLPAPGNLSEIKTHPFFTRGQEVSIDCRNINATNFAGELKMNIGSLHKQPALRVPTLKDLCIRACAEMAHKDSLNLEISDPGNGSSHDFLRLPHSDKSRIMHVLDKLNLLTEPRVLRRFLASKQEARMGRVRAGTHDFIGHTFREEGKPKDHEPEGQDPAPIIFVHLTNHLFIEEINQNCSDEDRDTNIALLKDCIRAVNKLRPKFVVVSGSYIDAVSKKWLGKISETIPVAMCDGRQYYNIWSWCNEVLIFMGSALSKLSDIEEEKHQIDWIDGELQQIKTSRRNVMVFVENDPRTLPVPILRKLAKNRTKCVLGCAPEKFRTTHKMREEQLTKQMLTKSGCNPDESSSDEVSDDESSRGKILLVSGVLTKLSLEAKYGKWSVEDITPKH